MKTQVTTGIVLTRTDFGEADRIVTLLTPDAGKLRVMARGVRKLKSKLAGGIELFSVSDITYVKGRGEIDTLISSRLKHHYAKIVSDIDRVQTGYELIKMLNKATEDSTDPEYFDLLQKTLEALNNKDIDHELIRIWFIAQLLEYSGHRPNLEETADGQKLDPEQIYNFDFETLAFASHKSGKFTSNDIKFLRIAFSNHLPKTLSQIEGSEELIQKVSPLVQTMLQTYVH